MVSTRELVEAFTAARGRNDAEAIAGMLAEDVAWHPPRGIKRRPFTGRETVTRALTGGTTGAILDISSIRRETVQILVDGDTGVVRQVMTATMHTGEEYRNDYCWVYRVADGRIAELFEYGDTLLTARAGFVPLQPRQRPEPSSPSVDGGPDTA